MGKLALYRVGMIRDRGNDAATFLALVFGATAVAWIDAGAVTTATPADFLIRGGTVYTGGDAPPFAGDVVIAGDKIVFVGTNGATFYQAQRVVNAHGKIV